MSQSDQPITPPPGSWNWDSSKTPASGYGQFSAGSWQNPGGSDAASAPVQSDTGTGFASPQSTSVPPMGTPYLPPVSGANTLGADTNFSPNAQNFQQVQPGIIPLRPLSLSDIFNASFRALREVPSIMFGLILGIWAVFSVISGIINVLAFPDINAALHALQDENANPTQMMDAALGVIEGSFITSIPTAIIQIAVVGVTLGIGVAAVAPLVLGRRPSVSDTWDVVKPQLLKLIGFSFLLELIAIAIAALAFSPLVLIVLGAMNENLLIAGLGVLLILATGVAGLILYAFIFIRIVFAIPAMVMEEISIGKALKRSWDLTKGSFWRIFGIIVLTYLILGAIMTGLSFIVQLFVSIAMAMTPDWSMIVGIGTALSSLITGIYVPFIAGVQSILYIDLRMRREGLALSLLRAAQQN